MLVEDWDESRAVVLRLPDAARRVAEVKSRRVALDNRDVVRASTHRNGTDGSPDEAFEQLIIGWIDYSCRRRVVLRRLGDDGGASPRAECQTDPRQQTH